MIEKELEKGIEGDPVRLGPVAKYKVRLNSARDSTGASKKLPMRQRDRSDITQSVGGLWGGLPPEKRSPSYSGFIYLPPCLARQGRVFCFVEGKAKSKSLSAFFAVACAHSENKCQSRFPNRNSMPGVQCLKRLYWQVHQPELGGVPDAAAVAIMEQAVRSPGCAAAFCWRRRSQVGRPEEAIRITRELIANPEVPAIFEAAFENGGVLVRVDILHRRRVWQMAFDRGRDQLPTSKSSIWMM